MKKSMLNYKGCNLANAKLINVTTDDLSNIFCIPPRQVLRMVENGMPRISDNNYLLIDSVMWYIAYLKKISDENNSKEIVTQKTRLLKAKAELQEIQIQESRKIYLRTEKVVEVLTMIISLFKEAMLMIPGRISQSLSNKNECEVKNTLTNEIQEMLNHACDKANEYISKLSVRDNEN